MDYGLGENNVHLHCDNCNCQHKNRYVIAYLMWRVLRGKSISLNFLIMGHTRFAPDWCFSLLKLKFCKELAIVSSLQEMETNMFQDVNIQQLLGYQRGKVFVSKYNYSRHPCPVLQAGKGDQAVPPHSFTSEAKRLVVVETHVDGHS